MKPEFESLGICSVDSTCPKSSSLSHRCPASLIGIPILKMPSRCPYREEKP